MTAAGQELLAQVDELMMGNRQTLDANPVGTVRELLARTPVEPTSRVGDRRVEEFLAATPVQVDATRDITEQSDVMDPASTSLSIPADGNGDARTEKLRQPSRTKPIYRQS